MNSELTQLARVRRWGRRLLMLRAAAQTLAAVLAAALVLGFADYLLHLPASLRGALALALATTAVTWLAVELLRIARFQPTLADVALRAERLYPQLHGSLATAVEFTEQPQAYANPERTAAFAAASVAAARRQSQGVALGRLVNPRNAVRAGAALLALVVATTVLTLAAPQFSAIAAGRWFTPWRAVAWPKRTLVVDATRVKVWPGDVALPLRAVVQRGYTSRLRVEVRYRFVSPAGQAGRWHTAIMNEQAPPEAASRGVSPREILPGAAQARNVVDRSVPRYERLIDLADQPSTTADDDGRLGSVQYIISADDDETAPATVRLIARPSITAVIAHVTPPAYAKGQRSPQTVNLAQHRGQLATATALVGSQVMLSARLNKPVTLGRSLAAILPGFADEPSLQWTGKSATDTAAATRNFDVSLTLHRTLETPIRVTDSHGLSNLSQRRYRLEATPDQPPAASLTVPDADEAVLATAKVHVAGVGRDDVAVESLELQARMPHAGSEPRAVASGEEPDSLVASTQPAPITLAQRYGQQLSLSGEADLDLAPYHLKPGDTVTLFALARDNFNLDHHTHEATRSVPRRLRIIDTATFIAQLRNGLSVVREQAAHLDERQQSLLKEPLPQVDRDQAEVSRRVDELRTLMRQLQNRASRNRLDAVELTRLMDQAHALLDQAAKASAGARSQLDKAKKAKDELSRQQKLQQARPAQRQVSDALSKVVGLLNQGDDALAMELRVRQLQEKQRALEAATRKLRPQTLGKNESQLTDEQRKALAKLAAGQAGAAKEAAALAQKMQATAGRLAAHGTSDRQKAAAEALAEAAATAQREGLSQKMRSASQGIGKNRLAQAGQQQLDSLELLQRMLDELGTQKKKMQALLRRRLEKLVRTIEELIERQKQQLAALQQAKQFAPLEPGQDGVRRATMAAQQSAEQVKETKPVATPLGEAVRDQGRAILAMRQEQGGATRVAEQAAVAQLEAALQLAKKQRDAAARKANKAARDKLEAAYLKLAAQQAALRKKTRQASAHMPMTRRDRAALLGLAPKQEDVRQTAATLGKQVRKTVLFEYLHERIDKAAHQIVDHLRQGDAANGATDKQAMIVRTLEAMAKALHQQNDSDFASPLSGGGGGGGGGGGSAALVPPLAELRLLRSMQSHVYDQTRQVEKAPSPGKHAAQLRDLGGQQAELSALGRKLIRKLKANQPKAAEQKGGS